MSEQEPTPGAAITTTVDPFASALPAATQPLTEEELEFIAQQEAEQQQWNDLYAAEEAHQLERAAHRRQVAEQTRQREERELNEWYDRNAERRRQEELESEQWRNR